MNKEEVINKLRAHEPELKAAGIEYRAGGKGPKNRVRSARKMPVSVG